MTFRIFPRQTLEDGEPDVIYKAIYDYASGKNKKSVSDVWNYGKPVQAWKSDSRPRDEDDSLRVEQQFYDYGPLQHDSDFSKNRAINYEENSSVIVDLPLYIGEGDPRDRKPDEQEFSYPPTPW